MTDEEKSWEQVLSLKTNEDGSFELDDGGDLLHFAVGSPRWWALAVLISGLCYEEAHDRLQTALKKFPTRTAH